MWIRTSDRKAIIDTSGMTLRISREPDGNIGIIAYGNNQPDDVVEKLASYDNEQRAVEVLDEICNAYMKLNVDAINYGCDNGGYVKNGVYQMPEE